MNHPISWDPSLVKKYSSSNHYKLLNQLKNEVKKYPLNNKKKASSKQIMDNNNNNINKTDTSHSQNTYLSNNSIHKKVENVNNSTVSFNNAKNFSLYKNKNTNRNNEYQLSEEEKLNEQSLTPKHKLRLEQIEMK